MSPEMKNLPLPHFPIFAAAALAALCPLNAPAAIETVTYGNFEISYFGLGDTDSDWLTDGLTGARDYSEDASETDPLMYKSLKNGEVRRELLAGELEILAAMGWSVIPEPSAFGLLAGTFALALVSVRRRRKIS